MSFKELSEKTGIKPTSLAYHLKILSNEDLIDKDFVKEKNRRDYTRYRLTEKGKWVFDLGLTIDLISDKNKALDGSPEDLHEWIEIIPPHLGPRVIRLRN